jgi:hypothetical protein
LAWAEPLISSSDEMWLYEMKPGFFKNEWYKKNGWMVPKIFPCQEAPKTMELVLRN